MIELLIFDLGNVVYKFSYDNAIAYWSMKYGENIRNNRAQLLADKYFELFEINAIDVIDYKNHIISLLNIDLSLEDFIFSWNSIFMNEIEGIRNLLVNLRNKYKIVALSNTNDIHWEFIKNKYAQLFMLFDDIYLSNKLKMRKPNKSIFEYVLAQNKIDASKALFFDDILENINCASEIGMKVVHVTDIKSIIDGLHTNNVEVII